MVGLAEEVPFSRTDIDYNLFMDARYAIGNLQILPLIFSNVTNNQVNYVG
jgi:hypothetical protein